MFEHTSVYDLRDASGVKVLVTRYWPRGIRKAAIDVWLQDAAPSRELLDAYRHHGLGWAEFEARYRQEIASDRPQALEQLRELERQYSTVSLLCYERMPPHEHCHRLTLLEMLRPSQ